MQYIRKTSQNFTENFLENLLIDRGTIEETPEFYNKFFHPTIENEHNPELLDNIDEGYKLLKKHLEADSRIYIVVD